MSTRAAIPAGLLKKPFSSPFGALGVGPAWVSVRGDAGMAATFALAAAARVRGAGAAGGSAAATGETAKVNATNRTRAHDKGLAHETRVRLMVSSCSVQAPCAQPSHSFLKSPTPRPSVQRNVLPTTVQASCQRPNAS